MLLGVDMVKDRDTLLKAYDDAAGVTAAFNRNILARINRELGADFVPEAFAHRAVWNRFRSRIEMHLGNQIPQTVHIPALDMRLEFEAGETIHTENSYKYQPGQAEAMLRTAGFAPEETWTDEKRLVLSVPGASSLATQGFRAEMTMASIIWRPSSFEKPSET